MMKITENNRRIDLILKSLDERLSEDESRELDLLNAKIDAKLKRITAPQIDALRRWADEHGIELRGEE